MEDDRMIDGGTCRSCGAIGPHKCPGLSITSATKKCITCGEAYVTNHYCQGPVLGTTSYDKIAMEEASKTPIFTELSKLQEAKKDSSENNGGATDYYRIDKSWEMIQDIIEDRNMNYAQANIFKAAFCFNQGRHSGTDYERELNKIIYFAQRELNIIKEQ